MNPPPCRTKRRSPLALILCFSLVWILGACTASRSRPTSLQAVPNPVAISPPTQPTNTQPPAALAVTPTPPPDNKRPPVARPPADPRWGHPDWVSVETWAAGEPGIGLQRLLGASGLAYDLTGPSGTVRLSAQAPSLICQGLQVYLGHTPGASNETLLVHRVDLAKNVRPLLRHPTTGMARQPKVMVDPGHGGDNPGARSVADGRLEKDLTLDWALRLAPLLEAQGWQVELTRTNDDSMSLSNRVAAAEAAGAALFISLHFNSTSLRTETRGIETFCLTPAGLPSTITRDYEDDPARLFPNNDFDELNLLLALRLHQALVHHCNAPDRGVRRARFTTVLRGQQRPAVLIEGGYLSHPEESRLIATPSYRQELAAAVATALGPAPTTLTSTTRPPNLLP